MLGRKINKLDKLIGRFVRSRASPPRSAFISGVRFTESGVSITGYDSRNASQLRSTCERYATARAKPIRMVL